MSFEIVNPIPALGGEAVIPPARSADLSGLRVGVHINGKEYSEQVLRRVAANLSEKFNFAEVIFWNKRYPAVPSPFYDEVQEKVDIVINGVGH